jgi:hypothetical protein
MKEEEELEETGLKKLRTLRRKAVSAQAGSEITAV